MKTVMKRISVKRAVRSLFAAWLSTLLLCAPLLSDGVVLATGTATETITAAESTVAAQPAILREATDRREETSKTFLRSDGSYVTYIYGTAIHEKDENGIWQEVDNRLTKKEDGIATADGTFTFAIDRPSVTMGEVSWTLTRDNGTFAGATATNTDTSAEYLAMSAKEKQTTATKATSQVTYLDGSGNGVRYAISSGRIKEDILLASPAAIDDYTVCFSAPGLTATLCEEGRTVTFADAEGETVLTVEVPYMEDAAEEVSTAIDLSMTQSDSTVLLHIRPDRDWLTDPDRAYPVVIDPVYYTSQTSGLTDTMVHTGDSTGTCSSCGLTHRTYNKMYVGLKDGKRYYAYIRFSPAVISENIIVTDATLKLYLPEGTSTGGPFSIYYTTETWAANSIKYSYQPASALLQSGVNFVSNSDGTKSASFDVTKCLCATISNPKFAQGLKIGYTNTSTNDYNSFYTSDYSTVSYRPRIAITYVVATKANVSLTANSSYTAVGANTRVSCTTSPSNASVSWFSNDPTVATVSSSGVVTGVSEGEATIYAYFYNASNSATYYGTFRICVLDSIGIVGGNTYTIKNAANGKVLYYDSLSSTLSLKTVSDDGWQAIQSGDKFKLGHLTGVLKANISNGTVTYGTNSGASNENFYIYRINEYPSTGKYLIMYIVGNTIYYVRTNSSNNGIQLSTTLDSTCFWSIFSCPGYEVVTSADVFTFRYRTKVVNGVQQWFDTTAMHDYFSVIEDELCYDQYEYTNSSPTMLVNALENTHGVLIYNGHGFVGTLRFKTDEDVVYGSVISYRLFADGEEDLGTAVYSIEDCDDNAFASKNLVAYFGCNTGGDLVLNGATYNLVDATYEKGARCVIGTTALTYVNDATWWEKVFVEALETENVSFAKVKADRMVPSVMYTQCDELGQPEVDGNNTNVIRTGSYPFYAKGDTSQRLY